LSRLLSSISATVLHGANEPIPPPRQGLDQAGAVRPGAQRIAQPVDDGIHALVEIDHPVVRPEAPAQLLPGHQLSRALEQRGQGNKGLVGERNARAFLEELLRARIRLEGSEPDSTVCCTLFGHMSEM
jgi:hypothetical protein